jgi:virginiamycin B lyase
MRQALALATAFMLLSFASEQEIQEYSVPASGPHEVAPAQDGTVWYTGQGSGELGRLDPATGEVRVVPLGEGSSPHGVIVGGTGSAALGASR